MLATSLSHMVSHWLLNLFENAVAPAFKQLRSVAPSSLFFEETKYDLRYACNVAVLRKCSFEAMNAYNLAYLYYANKDTGYKQLVLKEMKNLCKQLFSKALEGYSETEIISFLEERGVSRNGYLKKGALTRKGWVHFLLMVKPIECDRNIMVKRFGDLAMKLNNDHEAIIHFTDQELHDICHEIEALIFEVFVYWCFPEEMILTA
jgi:hypothetical protein